MADTSADEKRLAEVEAQRDALISRINNRLNAYLCEMKPDHDDSITGFNEAWDIVRAVFAERNLSRHLARERVIASARALRTTWKREARDNVRDIAMEDTLGRALAALDTAEKEAGGCP